MHPALHVLGAPSSYWICFRPNSFKTIPLYLFHSRCFYSMINVDNDLCWGVSEMQSEAHESRPIYIFVFQIHSNLCILYFYLKYFQRIFVFGISNRPTRSCPSVLFSNKRR